MGHAPSRSGPSTSPSTVGAHAIGPSPQLKPRPRNRRKVEVERHERAYAGITVYELARIMGTSVAMIEAHYEALIDTARESILERLEAVK